jgi:hypothetical protein
MYALGLMTYNQRIEARAWLTAPFFSIGRVFFAFGSMAWFTTLSSFSSIPVQCIQIVVMLNRETMNRESRFNAFNVIDSFSLPISSLASLRMSEEVFRHLPSRPDFTLRILKLVLHSGPVNHLSSFSSIFFSIQQHVSKSDPCG